MIKKLWLGAYQPRILPTKDTVFLFRGWIPFFVPAREVANEANGKDSIHGILSTLKSTGQILT